LLATLHLRSLPIDRRSISLLQDTLGWTLGPLLFAFYFIWFWMNGGTVGQRIFGLTVVSSDGGRPIFPQALRRLLALVVVQVVSLSVIGFGAFMVYRLLGRPFWIDTVSRTQVVSTRQA
jgi:uncharacterized RDD family membrane protein YckC